MSSHTPVSSEERKLPRAVIHKKILDAAKVRPGASLEELSNAVNGASVALVERVLDEYGDPAAGEGPPVDDESAAAATQSDGDPVAGEAPSASDESGGSGPERSQPDGGGPSREKSDEGTRTPNGTDTTTPDGESESIASMSKTETQHVERESHPVELTEKQRVVLQAIRESPDATQSELADEFGVTQSTINNRLNSIEGFDWKHRRSFIRQMFDDTDPAENGAVSSAAVQDLSNQLEELSAQVSTLERRMDESTRSDTTPFGDPDLACTVVRACINSEDVSAEEENRIVKAVITGESPPE